MGIYPRHLKIEELKVCLLSKICRDSVIQLSMFPRPNLIVKFFGTIDLIEQKSVSCSTGMTISAM